MKDTTKIIDEMIDEAPEYYLEHDLDNEEIATIINTFMQKYWEK